MEEKTLQELNNEYVSLVQEIREQKAKLEAAIASKDDANSELETAMNEHSAAKESYKIKKEAFEKAEGSGFSSAVIESLKSELSIAEAEMNALEETVKHREKRLKDEVSKFKEIEDSVKQQNNRMNLILVSFGGNETINKALVNELEIDYGEKVAEKEAKRDEIDGIKTKINDDPKIQENVADLQKLLEEFEIARAKATPDNLKTINEMAAQIKVKRDAIRRSVRKHMGKGGKITNEEIEAMTTARDEKGRFVIAELDRRSADLNKEIGSLLYEKKEIINSMAITLEMAKNLEGGTPEYQKLISEITALTQEVEDAEKQKQASEEKLSKIPDERTALEEELANLGSSIDVEAIDKLKAEKAAIEAEKVEMIDNPEIADIDAKIAELEEKIKAGGKGTVETEEYKKAKSELENAKLDLEKEIKNPSLYLRRKPTDVIEENPEYKKTIDEKENAEKEINGIIEKVRNDNPDLKDLYEELEESKQRVTQKTTEVGLANTTAADMKKAAMEGYVSEALYPGLLPNSEEGGEPKESDEIKAFNEYRAAELALRKAMIALQKDPSQENKKALLESISNYKNATNEFQNALSLSGATPTKEAMHNYLLGVLNEEDARDEGYDLNNVENRIKILEAQRKKTDTYALEYLKDSTEKLDDILEKMFKGEEVSPDELKKAIEEHERSIDGFEDPEAVKEVLTGTGLPVGTKKQGIFSKLFGKKWPKLEPKYDFGDNEETAAYKGYLDAEEELKSRKRELDRAVTERDFDENEYEEELAIVLSPESKDKIKDLKDKIKQLEDKADKMPKRINSTKLKELQEALKNAQEKLDNTEQYGVTEDQDKLRKDMEDLKSRKTKTPAKIESPEKKAEKEKRIKEKQDKIDELSKGGADVAKVTSVKQKLADLLKVEDDEKKKLRDAEEVIAKKSPELEDKRKRVSVLEVARQKMKNITKLIKIKNANSMLDRRFGDKVEDLAKAVKQKDEDGRE